MTGMNNDHASIRIANREFEIPLDQLVGMLSCAHPLQCEALFRREILRRNAIIAMRRARPERRSEFSLVSGRYFICIGNEHWRCPTLAAVLQRAMRWIHDHNFEALTRLSMKRKYTRAYVATDPAALYGESQGLVRHAREFAHGWYVDTNLSYENTRRFLAESFREVGLRYRQDWLFSQLY